MVTTSLFLPGRRESGTPEGAFPLLLLRGNEQLGLWDKVWLALRDDERSIPEDNVSGAARWW
jgi:hypothetical protein